MPMGFDDLAMILLGAGGMLAPFMGGDNDREEALKHLDTVNIMKDAQRLYTNYLGSPAYASAKNAILAGTTGGTNRLTASLAQRGLSTSGIGAIAPSLAMSGGALKQGELLSRLWSEALNSAMSLGQSRAGVATQTQQPNLGANLLGGGMDALSAFLLYSKMFGAKSGWAGSGSTMPGGWHPPKIWTGSPR